MDYPRVTKILGLLRPYGPVPPGAMALAQQRGKAAHHAIHLLDGGGDGSGLAWDTVHPIVRPYCEAWEKAKADARIVVVHSEWPVVSSVYRYAGTPDKYAELRGVPCVLDIKTGAGPLVALQLAAYADAIKTTLHLRMRPRRYSVWLRANGSYRLEERKEAADFPTFTALVQIYAWLSKYQARLIPAEIEPDYSNFEEEPLL